MRARLAWGAPATAFRAGGGRREREAGARGAGSAVTQLLNRGWQRVRCLCLVSNVTVSTAPGAALEGHGGPATLRAGWGSSWTGEAVLSLRPQQLKIPRAIVTGNKATGVFSALSRSPSALPPSREVLCPLHPGTAPPAPGCSHCASVSLLHTVLWCHPPSHCCHPTSSTPQRALSCPTHPLHIHSVPCP